MAKKTLSNAPAISPGTVSKILWHFTGGPGWNASARRPNIAPKPAERAFLNLKAILRSRTLKLGRYKEVVTVSLPDRRRPILGSKRVEVIRGGPVTIESAPVCCVCDIPAPHLRYHAYRYGRFAIGFHREAITHAGFNPVFYTLSDTSVVRAIHRGLSSLDAADFSRFDNIARELEFEFGELSFGIDDIRREAESLAADVGAATERLKRVLAFVKTFERNEFSTIYCEREWRSITPFKFGPDQVAMVVVTKRVGDRDFFRPFVELTAPRLKLPRRVSIVAWDDLVEH